MTTPLHEFWLALRKLLDCVVQADWDAAEPAAEDIVAIIRRRRLEAAANAAGVIGCGCGLCHRHD